MKLLDIFTFLRVDIINDYLYNIWHLVENVGNNVTWCLKEKGRKKDEKDCLSTATSLGSETENPSHICFLFQFSLKHKYHCVENLTIVVHIYNIIISHDDLPWLCLHPLFNRCIRSIIGRLGNMKKACVRVIHSKVFIKLLIRCILSMYFYLIISLSTVVNYFLNAKNFELCMSCYLPTSYYHIYIYIYIYI